MLGRYGQPDEVAYGVLYLHSDASAFMTGSELVTDRGWTAQLLVIPSVEPQWRTGNPRAVELLIADLSVPCQVRQLAETVQRRFRCHDRWPRYPVKTAPSRQKINSVDAVRRGAQTLRKKLIEVALPLEAMNREAAREKSIRHGHPSTLHLWWARRPLAACRAVLFAQLVDDPASDPRYPTEAAASLKRAELFNLIEDLVKWENTNNPEVIHRARAEIARCVAQRLIERGELEDETIVSGRDARPRGKAGAGVTAGEIVRMQCKPQVVDDFLAAYAPPVHDPFAGGGSIPLEAKRLGLRAHASDLNPVSVLITRALIEIPPKFAGCPPINPEWRQQHAAAQALQSSSWQGAAGLAADVRYYGKWMREAAWERIGHLYPKVKITPQVVAAGRPDLKPYAGQELTVIAWLWCRTVPSPDPSVGGQHAPLVHSFWLSKKRGKGAYVRPVVDRQQGTVAFQVQVGQPVDGFDPDVGTVRRQGATCFLTHAPIPLAYVREAGKAGEMSSQLMAIVCEGARGRVFVSPSPDQEGVADCAWPEDYPVTDIPEKALSFSAQLYGMDQHWKLFTPRQLTALVTFSDLAQEARAQLLADARRAWSSRDGRALDEGGAGPRAYADAVATYLALTVSRQADYTSTLCSWGSSRDNLRSVFTRQALPMVWDFAEGNPFSSSSGSWRNNVEWVARVIAGWMPGGVVTVRSRSATADAAYSVGEIISTDPPYYDNIGYADLSDFFYVWLRRSLHRVYPGLFSTMLTPKAEELIANPYRHGGSKQKAAAFFETGLGKAIGKWRKHGHADYPTTIFYAFKQAETDASGTASTGWETFLTGVIDHGFTITGTWPVRTEMSNRMVGLGTNALASSIILSCVPRSDDAPLATRRELLHALGRELPGALRTLQSGNIAPVDLAQAAIGPGIAIFSRYAGVVESDGGRMSVRTALALINQVLDEVLAEQEGEFDADTRWAVAWFEQHGMDAGDFGVAETLSKAKNTSVSGLQTAGVLSSRAGKVQLVARRRLPTNWDPGTDNRLTEWGATQHLIRTLDQQGESGAAELLRRLGGDYGDRARDLAYRLYHICERKKWASEAYAYNSLVVAWSEVTRLAQQKPAPGEAQTVLFDQREAKE
ncbi:hypothetical protein NKDENANG_03316 [Candidatus Entotheonellaceae bacterium PAL068K]